MPSQASDGLVVSRFRPLSMPYRRASSSRTSWNSCSAATIRGPRNWADGWGVHSLPSISTVGITGSRSSTGNSTVPVPSAIGVTILSADHSPVARDIAIPCRPSSRHSVTVAGYRIGMCRSTSAASDDDGIVDDLAAGSSPTKRQRTPTGARPGEHAVAHGVGGAVEAGRLAVPDADHTVVASVGSGGDQLRPHHGSRAEFLVDGRLVHDRQVGHLPQGARHLDVETAERRAGIARHERGRVAAGCPVAAELFDRDAGQRLDSGEEHLTVVELIPIRELVLMADHRPILADPSRPIGTVRSASRLAPASIRLDHLGV